MLNYTSYSSKDEATLGLRAIVGMLMTDFNFDIESVGVGDNKSYTLKKGSYLMTLHIVPCDSDYASLDDDEDSWEIEARFKHGDFFSGDKYSLIVWDDKEDIDGALTRIAREIVESFKNEVFLYLD